MSFPSLSSTTITALKHIMKIMLLLHILGVDHMIPGGGYGFLLNKRYSAKLFSYLWEK